MPGISIKGKACTGQNEPMGIDSQSDAVPNHLNFCPVAIVQQLEVWMHIPHCDYGHTKKGELNQYKAAFGWM